MWPKEQKPRWHKLVAPIVITTCLVAILAAYLVAFALIPAPIPVRLAGVLVIGALIGASIFVLWERIQEIRSGAEDDLSQY